MEILITGGNGFLGHHLIPALQERGDNLRVLALPAEDTTWLESRGVQIFRGDLRDPDALTTPLRTVNCVFHLAAMISGWRPIQEYYAVNVTGTQNVCRAALDAGVNRLIHISSAMVYDMAAGRPVTEDDPLDPIDEPYSSTKAEGDKLVQKMIAEEHLPAVIIRPTTLFGPGDLLNFGRIAERLLAGKGILIGSGDNAVPFVHVTDVVQGLLLAMSHARAAGQVYNIASDQVLSQQMLFSSIARAVGVPPPRRRVPYHLLYAAAYAAERIGALSGYRVAPFVTRHGVKLYGADNLVSIGKAQRDLGYKPQMDLNEGVEHAAILYLEDRRARAEGRVVIAG